MARLLLAASLCFTVLCGALPAHVQTAAAATTPNWLARLNGWRAIAGVPALPENAAYSAGDYNHSVYMVKNNLATHGEDPTKPYYTASGAYESLHSNIEVSSSTSTSDESAIDWWMAAPFHELGMMDPRLTQVGFGAYREVKSGWQAGFSLDVQSSDSGAGSYPVYFPGNNTTEPLRSYGGGEFPDPLSACPGYSAPTGLPITVQVGSNVATSVSASSFTGNGTPLANCVIASNTPGVGSSLTWRGAVILIPRSPLLPGVQYVAALTVNGVPRTWTFNVSSTGAMVPGSPSINSAVAGDTTATVNWTAPLYTGGTAVATYTVTPYVGSTAQSPQVITAPATTAIFTGLTDGTTYWFTVAATNSIGTGPAASSYSVTPTSAATPPARITASGVLQYRLPNSDGVTWQDMDATNLSLSVTPSANMLAVISANADLWTANAGVNQDIGIWLSSLSDPASIVAWKESGGLAGTFSPNAAVVQTVFPMAAGTTYSVKLDWKTNAPALGASIFAGAGPIGGQFSPARLSVVLIPVGNLATAVSSTQYPLANSDGVTWQPVDVANLNATFVAPADGTAVVSANVDLWTANSGFNQDLAVFVSVNGAADQLVGWKESGGRAGAFSPNAAFLQATWPITSASTYIFKLKWKANRSAPGATIFAGAGPLGGHYSPTRLTAFYEPTAAMRTAVANSQEQLTSSDGATWSSLGPSTVTLPFTPGATAAYLVSANADLWTANAGYNQDFGIYISGGAFGAGTLLAWKESGGSAGTFSPNAAYVETSVTLQSGTAYTVWIVWKTNRPAGGASIYAGAGPLSGGSFSPTRLMIIPG